MSHAAARLGVTAPMLAALTLLGPGSASVLAAGTSPASDQYGGGAGLLGETAGGSLPFTGINLIVLLGLALCMLTGGFGMRRLSGRHASISDR